VGISRHDINPPPGIFARCWGSAQHDVATGLHRPLLASCVAFSDTAGDRLCVLLSLDLSWWSSKQDADGILDPILAGAGLEAHQLMLHLSHTHSAPRTAPELSDRPGGQYIQPYREQLIRTCLALIEEARQARSPATVTWRAGQCALAFNRDLPAPDGRVLCGINPAAPADGTLLVGRICDAAGKTRATLVNYACHPISLGGGNTQVSPDYVGATRETVEKATGGAPCVFLHGASGDQAPRRSFESDPAVADRNGEELGYAALAVLTSLFPAQTSLDFAGAEESGTPLALWKERPAPAPLTIASRRVTVRLRIADMPSADELRKAISEAREGYMVERLMRRLFARQTVGDGPEGEFSFVVWQLGHSFIVGTPAEMHSAFQRELRRRFPSAAIAVLNIVNGYASYLPPEADFSVGAYPVRVTYYAKGSMEIVLAATDTVIREMLTATGLPH
ncbi:MAG TPA: hypothetical protein VHB68_09045, partial [Steroidobacteraceae bacterium]|nr:hypothetical protein [Steroidobacteraceae bacterium]